MCERMQVNVLGLVIPIERDDIRLQALGAMGAYDYGEKTIYLQSEYDSADELVSTLVHEMGHAVLDRVGGTLGGTLEEILVETIALVITENFQLILRKPLEAP